MIWKEKTQVSSPKSQIPRLKKKIICSFILGILDLKFGFWVFLSGIRQASLFQTGTFYFKTFTAPLYTFASLVIST
jgi:hypothetical protein